MFKESEVAGPAQRIQNGIDAFIEVIMSKGYDRTDANAIYQVMRDLKVLNFDYGVGRVSVKHGALLEQDSLDAALDLSKTGF